MKQFLKTVGLGVACAIGGAIAYAVIDQIQFVRSYEEDWDEEAEDYADIGKPQVAEKAKCGHVCCPCVQKTVVECPFGMSVCPHAAQDGVPGQNMKWCIHTAEDQRHYCPFNLKSGCEHLQAEKPEIICPHAWDATCPGKDTVSDSDVEDTDRQEEQTSYQRTVPEAGM